MNGFRIDFRNVSLRLSHVRGKTYVVAADEHDGLGNYRVITNFRSRRMRLKDVLAAMDSLAAEAVSVL